MFSVTNNLATMSNNRRIFRNSREDDPEAYVRGWASTGTPGEEAKFFYFRDHLAGEAQMWPKSISWNTEFETLCTLFLRRLQGRMSSIAHIKTLAKEVYREGSFLAYLDKM